MKNGQGAPTDALELTADQATAYGKVSIADARPAFAGPLRFARIACPGFSAEHGAIQLEGRADKLLTSFDADAGLRIGPATIAGGSSDGRFLKI